MSSRRTLTVLLALLAVATVRAADDPIRAAADFRKGGQPVAAASDSMVIAEAEEFRVRTPGWKAQAWGTNYYAATFANSFLSRKGYLGAPEQCDRTEASIDVEVPAAGKYLALVRYEAAYRFETRFTLRVEQNGKVRLERLYGARDNLKIWAFKQGLKKEVAWDWGAGENVVWEGHDAFVELEAGKATLTLVAEKQPGDAARRNVDLVLLTRDVADVQNRIAKENYLPLDGLLTQAGDVYLKVSVPANAGAVTITIPSGTEHSPYWVHMRTWKPKTVEVQPNQVTDWIEVGSLLDSLNDGQWTITAKSAGKPSYRLEFGVRGADGKIAGVRFFDNPGETVRLAYDADTRYTRRIRLAEEVLDDLLAYLKAHPVQGKAPTRTLIYGYTFDRRPGDAAHNAKVDELIRLTGATALSGSPDEIAPEGLRRGSIDVRGVPTAKLEEHCKKLVAEGKADRIAVISLGDEIGLARPQATDHAGFRAYLKAEGIKPSEFDPAFGDDWEKVRFSPTPETAKANPALYYHSQRYAYRFGIRQLKERTDILRKHFPNAGIGANFSPHHGSMYMGSAHQWISLFREDGMTMPWGEDYIWQVQVGTQQMNFLSVDIFRAGVRGKPDAKIHYYVMPHTPGNTTANWRRQFYGDLAHGVKVFNLFEFRPVQAAYTENHCSDPAMFQEVRRSLHELGTFEDIIQDGQVRPGVAALWFSEAADVWNDNRPPFDAAKRCLYIAVRHQGLSLDVVTEGDDLKSYQVLYLTDRHVSRKASAAIAAWVKGGGRLIVTAGAGVRDEHDQPNKVLMELLGVEETELIEAKEVIRFEKQDLPFAEPVGVAGKKVQAVFKAYGARSRIKADEGTTVLETFTDDSPAITARRAGKGDVLCFAFLPGLSYFKPALPKRPVDRGTNDDTLSHLIPTGFDPLTGLVFRSTTADIMRPVDCSEHLVETTVIESKHGVAIPLINWSKGPVKGLKVTATVPLPKGAVSLASGGKVQVERQGDTTVFTLDLDVADAIIVRP
jgi:hypothetical protein